TGTNGCGPVSRTTFSTTTPCVCLVTSFTALDSVHLLTLLTCITFSSTASLLGFACSIDEQCTLKVPNSQCQDGLCQCKPNFSPLRRDKCLPRKSICTCVEF